VAYLSQDRREVRILAMGVNTTTPTGKLVINVLGVMTAVWQFEASRACICRLLDRRHCHAAGSRNTHYGAIK
jgi:hypothetical protein